jgi:chitodextrinase
MFSRVISWIGVVATVLGAAVAQTNAATAALAGRAQDRPAPVTGLTASATESTATLSWRGPTSPRYTGVVVRRRAGEVAPLRPSGGHLVGRLAKPQHVVHDLGLKAGTTYSYAVFTYNRAHRYSRRVVTTVTTEPSTPPVDRQPPGVVSGVNPAAFDHSVAVAWANPEDVDLAGLVIRRAEGATAPSRHEGREVADLDSSVEFFGDSGLAAAATYSYSIFAYDTSDTFGRPASFTVTTEDDMTPPSPVQRATATATETSVSLAWTLQPADDLAFITVVRRTDRYPTASADGTVVTVLHPAATSFIDSSVVGSTTYFYTIFTEDRSGNVSSAHIFVSTAQETVPPGPVENLQGANVEPDPHVLHWKLTWTNPTDDDFAGIRILRKQGIVPPASPTDGQLLIDTDTPITEFVDTGFDWTRPYTYAVFAKDAHGNYSQPRLVGSWALVAARTPHGRLAAAATAAATVPPTRGSNADGIT